MLRKLVLEGVGPARKMEAEFAERLNLITGDNGLGKSFLLDVAWWALTRTWPRPNSQVIPRPDAKKASIHTSVLGKGRKPVDREIDFKFTQQMWVQPPARPPLPGLVIYAQVDGGFSVWDPERNYWSKDGDAHASAYLFNSRQVWTGIRDDEGDWRCNGLYRDWASWQRENNEAFAQLKLAMEALSPPNEILGPGVLTRIRPEDSQDYPTVHMPYGIDVPLVHASAAIRRVFALAYLLIWTWQEHLRAAALRREDPTHRVIFLIDEVESHLHPAWQKRIMPCLLKVVEAMKTASHQPSVQVIASTHSPLVCVSLEPFFDDEQDRIFDLDLDPTRGVRLEAVPFSKRGTSESWLVSRHFDLKSGYSEEAEGALAAAAALIEREVEKPGGVKKAEFIKLDERLRTLLSDTDSSWVRWRSIGEKRGWLK